MYQIHVNAVFFILHRKYTAEPGINKGNGWATAMFKQKKSQDGFRKKVKTKKSKFSTYMYI